MGDNSEPGSDGGIEGPAVEFKWEGRPVRLHFPYADDHIARVIRDSRTFYEIDMLRDVRARLFYAKCAVDAGAHVGNHTVFFAHVLGLRTVAFEPNPQVFRYLQANVAANALGARCKLHPTALGPVSGRARLHLPDQQNSGTAVAEPADEGDIEMATLDAVLADEPQIDVIKIDVEGSEQGVMKGGLTTIARHRPLLYVEAKEGDFSELRDMLADARYVCWMRFNFTPTFLFLPEERLQPTRPAARSKAPLSNILPSRRRS